MLKRTFALVLSAALSVGVATTIIIIPVNQASAEMATAPQPKTKSGTSGAERRKTCSAEWKAAKAAGKTGGLKWPKFYSDCNKRLKAQGA
jgi:hypothetical protein